MKKRKKVPPPSNAKEFDAGYPKCPPLVKKLLAANEFKFARAGQAANVTGSLLSAIAHGHTPVSERTTAQIEAAWEGKPLPRRAPGGRDSSGQPRIATIVMRNETVEPLYDLCKTLGGDWAWKKRAGTHWVAVVRMGSREIDGYLTIARNHGAESFVA